MLKNLYKKVLNKAVNFKKIFFSSQKAASSEDETHSSETVWSKINQYLNNIQTKKLVYMALAIVLGIIVFHSIPLEEIKIRYISGYSLVKADPKEEESLLLFEAVKDSKNLSAVYVGTAERELENSVVILLNKEGVEKQYDLNPKLFDFFIKQAGPTLSASHIKLVMGRKEEILRSKLLRDVSNEKINKDKVLGSNAKEPEKNLGGVFLNRLGDNFAMVFKFLMAISFLLFLPFMIYMLGHQMGWFSKDFEAVNPEEVDGSMDELIGMEDIKKEVMQLKDIFTEREKYEKHDIHHGFNVMFTGPAGVGKTKLAGYLAKELNLPLIVGSAANLENGFVAGGVGRLRALYKRACRFKRAIIFLDEAEILFKKRGASNVSKFEDDTTNAFLALLDGVSTKKNADVIWIVATNFDNTLSDMDEAVLRRFKMKINFRMPNREERFNILKYYLSRKSPELISDDLNLDYIADITTKISPAILKSMTDSASMIAVSENKKIDTNLLMRAFERHMIGLADRKTTDNLDEQRKVIALHEWGHFFMNLEIALRKKNLLPLTAETLALVKNDIKVLKISTESVSKGGVLGFVLSKPEDTFIVTKKDLENQVQVLYGGVANEELFFGKENISTGSYNDIKEVTKILKHMVMDLEMYNNKKVNYSMISEHPNEKKLAQIETIAENNYQLTIESLKKYQTLTTHMVPILMDRYSLTLSEIIDEMTYFLNNTQAKNI